MQRRGFLKLLGVGAAVPLVPTSVAARAAPAAYSRTMYGMAVFHARTRATLAPADLVARLGVSAAQAEGMIGEMIARGVVTQTTATAASVRALTARGDGVLKRVSERVKARLERRLRDTLTETEAEAETPPEEPQDGQV